MTDVVGKLKCVEIAQRKEKPYFLKVINRNSHETKKKLKLNMYI